MPDTSMLRRRHRRRQREKEPQAVNTFAINRPER
jgi:hypothetical protein